MLTSEENERPHRRRRFFLQFSKRVNRLVLIDSISFGRSLRVLNMCVYRVYGALHSLNGHSVLIARAINHSASLVFLFFFIIFCYSSSRGDWVGSYSSSFFIFFYFSA